MRVLERTYSKSERIVARARFSGWAFLHEVVLAVLLGGIIAALWIYGDTIEKALNPDFGGSAAYITPDNLKWALLASALLVALCAVIRALVIYRQEIIVTEDKFIYKSGVGSVKSVMLPLNEIRYIDVRQNVFQVALGYGKIKVITDGEEPFVIKNLVRPEKFARRIMRQCSTVRENAARPRLNLGMSGK